MGPDVFGTAEAAPDGSRASPVQRLAKHDTSTSRGNSLSPVLHRLYQAEGRTDPRRSARSRVFGLAFSPDTMEELIEAITDVDALPRGAKTVATANLDHIVTLRTNPAFRGAYQRAWRVTADGTPVFLYAKAMGLGLRERVTGSDLFATLMTRWRPADHRLYLLVSNDATGRKIRSQLRQRGFDANAVMFEVPPFGFEKDAAYSDGLADRIRAFAPTHLIMGVGAPKSEIWADQYQDRLGDLLILCVGASIEFVTGEKRRSPMLLRQLGLEWLWRFAMEPRRLFSRYFIRSLGFVRAVIADQRSEGRRC